MTVPGNAIPVFNCIVDLTRAEDGSEVVARVVNLAGIEAVGTSEREALAAAAGQFKAMVQQLHAQGETIPWLTEVLPAKNTTRRFIAVHL